MNKFGLLLGLTLAGSPGAAPPPDAMRELLEQTETEQAAVTRLDLSSLTAQQRAFYERGVVLKDGYRFVDSLPGLSRSHCRLATANQPASRRAGRSDRRQHTAH
jgi:hypothetical protein